MKTRGPGLMTVLIAGLLAEPSLWAQGCSMCKTSLAGQVDSLIASLSLGIVILLVPPLAILAAILYVAHRRGGFDYEYDHDYDGDSDAGGARVRP